jgi:chorismate-pyruvate lyase
MGPFYKTNSAVSTTCANLRTGNLAIADAAKKPMGESLFNAQSVTRKSFNLFKIANLHQSLKPVGAGN